jgi:hypothetical protein
MRILLKILNGYTINRTYNHFCHRIVIAAIIFSAVSLSGALAVKSSGQLIIKKDEERSFISYEGEAIFAFGPSPQNILTYLPSGNGNDISDWVEWAQKYNMKHVRSYPPSIKVDKPSVNIFKRSTGEPDKFDLQLFNNSYFDELRKACLLLKKRGIIVHFQLWQAVYWKKSWGRCYYNPKNNTNPDISAHAGPSEFVTMKNTALLDHQKRYVRKILDATGDLGNVFYDVMNEIGNGTGKSEAWVWEIIKTINEWEIQNGIDVLITLNDEGGKRMGKFSLYCPGLDLIVKDLGRYDEHVEAQTKYGKPTISVRNIDYDYEDRKRLYFFGKYNLEVNLDQGLQARGRKYWWRMFMSGVQIAGGYSDAYHKNGLKWFSNRVVNKFGHDPIFDIKYIPSYRMNTESEANFSKFVEFINQLTDYESLVASTNVLVDHPVKNSYILQSKEQAVIYLESPNGKAGFKYDQKMARLNNLILPDGKYKGNFYFPYNGRLNSFSIDIENGMSQTIVPSFKDDLVILIK